MSSNQKVYAQVNLNGKTIESFDQTEMKYQLILAVRKLQELANLPADQIHSLDLRISRNVLDEEGVDFVVSEMHKDGRDFDQVDEPMLDPAYGEFGITVDDMMDMHDDPVWTQARRVIADRSKFTAGEIERIKNEFNQKFLGTKFYDALWPRLTTIQHN